MTVGFGRTDFERRWRRGSEEVRFVEEGFGALNNESGWWRGAGEDLGEAGV